MQSTFTLKNKAQIAHPFKIGSTLVIPAQAFDDAGLPLDLTNIAVKSQLRLESGKLVETMEVQWVDRAQGSFALWLPGTGTTAGYEPGRYALDIFYTDLTAGFGGRPLVAATESLAIDLVRAETT